MATPLTMEASTSQQKAPPSELEKRTGRIADPNNDLRTKHAVAGEIRELLETLREGEVNKGMPFLVNTFTDLLRSGEPSSQKESLEYQFRRCLLELIHKLPVNDVAKGLSTQIYACMFHLLRHDNEENGVTACKILLDCLRAWRGISDEHLTEFVKIYTDCLENMKETVSETLSEDSPVLDPNALPMSMRSFKVVGDLSMIMVIISPIHRPGTTAGTSPIMNSTIAPSFDALALESSAQHKAREDSEAMGGVWSGMAPTIKNASAYTDFHHAQIKVLSFLAYVMRFQAGAGEADDTYGERLIVIALRMLQDCPATGITLRKELMVVFRHLMGLNARKALFPVLDKLFNEDVLLGTGVGSKEMLRTAVYSAIADLVHHIRNDLEVSQLRRIIELYSGLIHNPTLGNNIHTLSTKMIFGLIEQVDKRETKEGAISLLGAIFETSLERLEALAIVYEEVVARNALVKADPSATIVDIAFIEKSRPVGGAVYSTEKIDDMLQESRQMFRSLLHGFRVCLTALRKHNAPTIDGELFSRLFEGCIRCMALFDPELRANEHNDALDWFGQSLLEINLYVFQEVWTQKMEFFFQSASKRLILLNICQFLFTREATSPTLLAIVLNFLVDRLELLGEYDDMTAAATIRLYKMAFGAVAAHPTLNEPILKNHLAKLLMDCFPLAAKASRPANYLHLLRALFRAIGGGGGRFELLYGAVLPLLPELLDSLNRQLQSSEGQIRDMIVELCLTVPLRLTHLLPHLTYLMSPLALALRGGPDLVSQGLRTLELCIDNLTPDFLDPTLSTVLRELMEALHSHLRPIPASHHHAHTTIRILGKLGGRNRRLLTKEPCLKYQHHSDPAKLTLSFGSMIEKVDITSLTELCCKTVSKGSTYDRENAFIFLEGSIGSVLYEGVQGRNVEENFVKIVEGLFDAFHVPELHDRAEALLVTLARLVFETETKKGQSRAQGGRTAPSSLLSSFLDAFPHALAREQEAQATEAQGLISRMIEDLISMIGPSGVQPQIVMAILHQIANRFASLCYDDAWNRKRAGAAATKIMTQMPNIGHKWVADRGIDFIRTLLHILKDIPRDLPKDADGVIEVLLTVLRLSTKDLDFQTPEARERVLSLVGIIFPELQSSISVVRQAAQTSIDLLVEISGRPVGELLLPHRDRLLGAIYTKPLRALPFSKQIGMIEAVRHCISLECGLIELNDELLRLLHETLALADAEDSALLGRVTTRQGNIEVVQLRVACIKLLTASGPLTEFFQRQHSTRQRVTTMYFKSLYSSSADVKAAAHEGLKMVLMHQSRLPKELLQTGLRPILMNLADPKRLSVPGLEGLARLLELLTNYFKVEIGHKLLDHYSFVADPALLNEPSRLPLSENEAIKKLVQLVNVFHLLPSSANIFLEKLVNNVVQTESAMHLSSQSPFSEPLAKYLDRYPTEAIDFFFKNLKFSHHLRTLRSIIEAKLAPNLERDLSSRITQIVGNLRSSDESLVIPALLICTDLAKLLPTWLAENNSVIDAVIDVWNADFPPQDKVLTIVPIAVQRRSLAMNTLIEAVKQTPRIDLIFEIVSIFSRNSGMDLVPITHFLYQHVALSDDIFFRRNILMRFLTWFPDPSFSWAHKTHFIRYVVTPTLLVQANRPEPRAELVDKDFIRQLLHLIWHPLTESDTFADVDDLFKIEILHFTTVMVRHYSSLLDDAKKDIIKFVMFYISRTGEDIIVRQTAYLLAARFFAAFPTPQKFILHAWTGLLRMPHAEGKASLRQEALNALVPSLPSAETGESGHPQWAKATRRLLAEEGIAQHLVIYQLIVKHPHLFYPVRSLFVPHMANSLSKIGGATSNVESKLLTIELLQVIYNWEEQAAEAMNVETEDGNKSDAVWTTPLAFRENMVSYLVRLSAMTHEPPIKAVLIPRALTLLQTLVGPDGWTDVAFGLRFFSRALEQSDLTGDTALAQAISHAKVLQVIAAEQNDEWYQTNTDILQSLIRKGLINEDASLHDALRPIFDRFIKLNPLVKEDEEQPNLLSSFHRFVYDSVNDGLKNSTALRSTLLILKSVIRITPERIESFHPHLGKLFQKLFKDHVQSITNGPPVPALDSTTRLIIDLLEIYQTSVAFLGDTRRWFLSTLVVLVEKTKSIPLSNYILDLAKTWAMAKQESYPTMKEKASLLQKMIVFESRNEALFHSYLELIYEIYTDPSLRRSELTFRLEHSFMLGCRTKDSSLRERFMDLLDASVPRSLLSRLTYILGVQSWEGLADQNWIYLAIHLILGAVDAESLIPPDRRMPATSTSPIQRPKSRILVKSMQRLLFLDPQAAHNVWVSLFPAIWSSLSRREQADITHHMINLLSKEYHMRQAFARPNVVQTLLAGIFACTPAMVLPPHLVKYLSKSFGAWHVGLELLGLSFEQVKEDEPAVRDFVYDSMADLYADIAEEDLFYGLWRRRCLHQDTNTAIAFEQNGMWEQASIAYENALSKTRTGTIPFTESEYCLWEDHWILSSEKLQHWDLLYDLARNEGNPELLLESAWRTVDWSEQKDSLEEHIAQLPDTPTPRKRVYEAFLALLKHPSALDKNLDFTRLLEDAMQLSLRKWAALPPHLSAAHIPLLQHFQQFVELQEAVQIFGSLSQTNAQNLEKKSSELKMVLQAWRERLPNQYDDISIWSDLVAWRQNVFHCINNAYIPLINGPNQQAGATNNQNTFGYRGYHETAWIINRFAHVARKHDLLDVCFASLTKIYTLPNIEISEAFLKLREQARCHYQRPNDLAAGLEVINNTNLMFFSTSQKAEFHTLKGMFHARFGRNEEANQAFGQAVQLDITQAKAWAEWGRFNDNMFKETPNDLSYAANAVSCYLQAAGQYKSGKSRPMITRVLWLLSLEDGTAAISRAFDTYKGDAAFWYWISLVPQLCLSLSHRELKQARYILLNLARLYPQALFYYLRTTREEMIMMKRQVERQRQHTQANNDPTKRDGSEVNGGDINGSTQTNATQTSIADSAITSSISTGSGTDSPATHRHPVDYVEEVMSVLKTSFPLLTLSLETMVDQIQQKFKALPEEDVYRSISLMLQDAIQNYLIRANAPDDDGKLQPGTVQTLTRMETNFPEFTRKEFKEDFLTGHLTVYEYIQKLQKWRDRYEAVLDSRPRLQPLAALSHYLTEFHYNKVDEIEVPGQYTEDKDSNQNFVKIAKFAPRVENCRMTGTFFKRLTLDGSDNSKTSFVVQSPCHRQARREERVLQMLRTLNGALGRKKESRKRNLAFHLPVAVPCNPVIRLIQGDSSYTSLGDIYDLHCQNTGISREEPLLYSGEKVKKVLREYRQPSSGRQQLTKVEYVNLKKDILEEAALKMIPDDILTQYMISIMADASELWRMRKQFALQTASCSFITYLLCLSSRVPVRFQFSRTTGLMAMTEILPGMSGQIPVFATSDVVPFRLTPNMQNFIGPVYTEGILASGIMAIGRCLTEPEFDLGHQLCLFVRDEVAHWLSIRPKPPNAEQLLRHSVNANIENIVKKAETMACKLERDQMMTQNNMTTPVVQTVTNLISSATNPLQLAKMGEVYHPWF